MKRLEPGERLRCEADRAMQDLGPPGRLDLVAGKMVSGGSEAHRMHSIYIIYMEASLRGIHL